MNEEIILLRRNELYDMIVQAVRDAMDGVAASPAPRRTATGAAELAPAIGCGQTKIYEMLKAGVLEDAIVSSVGRRRVYDVDLAIEAARKYSAEQRHLRQERIAANRDRDFESMLIPDDYEDDLELKRRMKELNCSFAASAKRAKGGQDTRDSESA